MSRPILAIYGIQDRFNHSYPGYTHDHNLTVMCDGQITDYIHLERLSRRKYDNRLSLFIEDILQDLNLEKDFDLISVNSFVGSSFISQNGRLRIEPIKSFQSINSTQKASAWYQYENWQEISPNASIISHELAHIFSTVPFFGRFKENSLLVHFDGGASLGNFSAFHYKNGEIILLESHWELSHLSKIFNDNALSFALMKANPGEHCSVAGKLMGYAALGKANDKIMEWLTENNYFKDIWDNELSFKNAAKRFNWKGSLENNRDDFLMNVAASLQMIFQNGILNKLTTLKQQTKTDYLYYTGGCALNIITNSAILQKGIFKNIFIPPCCNDSGLSIGAAVFQNWKNKEIKPHPPYLNNYQSNNNFSYTPEDIAQLAKQIAAGKIIGICNGNGAIGPRALGNRSIIARADNQELAQKISMQCKQREWFRPVAPILLEKNAKKVTGLKQIHHLSKYMLLSFNVLEKYHGQLKGTVHKNGTARIQTIFEHKNNPFIYDLLTYLEAHFGIIAIINTSFNKKGKPIAQTAEDAQKAAIKMNLDGVVINGRFKQL